MPMPTRAAQWRLSRAALGRKGAYEAEWLNDDDNCHDQVQAPTALKQSNDVAPSSPVSVASMLDMPVEVKPISLPDAWVTVGKGGKPLKNLKMYEEPPQKPVAKKKTKKKARRTAEEAVPMVVALEETASSSKCLREVDRSTMHRDKQVMRARDAKYWAKYQRAKQLQRDALEELMSALSGDEVSVPKPAKSNKANSSKDKARRRARSEAAAARCFPYDLDEKDGVDEFVAEADGASVSPEAKVRGELLLMLGSRATLADDKVLTLPDAWTTVGRGGKALSNFPPLPSAKPPAEPSIKRRKSGEGPPPKSAKHETPAKSKCVMM